MAYIRSVKPSDFEATAHICRATLPPSLASSDSATRLAPYLWTHQYTLLSPETCFVLDDGAGRAVGYVIGCANVPDFVAEYPRYVAEILEPSEEITRPDLERKLNWHLPSGEVDPVALAQYAFCPDRLLIQGKEDLVEKYCATMHIDLLEQFQRKGWGRKLIDRFVQSVKEKGGYGQGIHIGIAVDNEKVVGFYKKVGFELDSVALKKGGGIWMTRRIE